MNIFELLLVGLMAEKDFFWTIASPAANDYFWTADSRAARIKRPFLNYW